MSEFTIEAIAEHDAAVVQRLLKDGAPIGIQITLPSAWAGYQIDTGVLLDPEVLALTPGKQVQVAFGKMEGFAVQLKETLDNRILVVENQLGEVVPAGDVLWILDVPVPVLELPPLPPVPPVVTPNAPFQLGGLERAAGYLKGDLGMTRLIERSPIYNGPGDLSEIPTLLKTADKVPTANGTQWPRGSKHFFDETEGREYILQQDIDGNYDRMDTPSGTRTIYEKKRIVVIVPKPGTEIVITCPFLHTESYKDTQMDVGNDLKITVENDATITVKGNADITVEKDATVQIDGTADITVKKDVTLTANKNLDATVKSNCTLDVKGNLEAKAGGQAKVQASGQVTIKGSLVMIN